MAFLQGYNYSVGQLNSLLLTLFKRYSELLQRKFSGDFEQVRFTCTISGLSNSHRFPQIVFDDDHQSMVVKDKEEFDKVISVSWLPATGEWSADSLEEYVLSLCSCLFLLVRTEFFSVPELAFPLPCRFRKHILCAVSTFVRSLNNIISSPRGSLSMIEASMMC